LTAKIDVFVIEGTLLKGFWLYVWSNGNN